MCQALGRSEDLIFQMRKLRSELEFAPGSLTTKPTFFFFFPNRPQKMLSDAQWTNNMINEVVT